MEQNRIFLGDGFSAALEHEPGRAPELLLSRNGQLLVHAEIPAGMSAEEPFTFLGSFAAQIWMHCENRVIERVLGVAQEASLGGEPDE